MKNSFNKVIFHLICYYLSWFSCILFASYNNPYGGPLVVLLITILQIIFLKNKVSSKILFFSPVLVSTGFIIDSILVYYNFIDLKANPFIPLSSPWMIALWVNFSIIFFDCFYNYFNKYLIWFFLSFFGFPLAYLSGVYFDAAYLPKGDIAYLILGVTWAFIMPLICYVFRDKNK